MPTIIADGTVPWFMRGGRAVRTAWEIQVAPFRAKNGEFRRSLPGITKITNLKSGHKLDKKEPKGKDGGTITSTGRAFTTFDIAIVVGYARLGSAGGNTERESDWAALLEFLSTIRSDGKKTPNPFDIYSPELDAVGVRSVWVETIEGPTRVGQTVEVTLNCVEWAPPQKKDITLTPKVSVAKTPTAFQAPNLDPPPAGPTPLDQLLASKQGAAAAEVAKKGGFDLSKITGLPTPTPPSKAALPNP